MTAPTFPNENCSINWNLKVFALLIFMDLWTIFELLKREVVA